MAKGKGDGPGDGARGAERLRDYWENGAGAAKIRWGQPGDFSRCVDQLTMHARMTKDNAEGYCYNRHVGALGYSPQEHGKREGGGKGKRK